MIAPRYIHSKFLFLIPISQAVLLITVLDFIKNTIYFARQSKNLSPSTPEYDGTGTIIHYRVKDTAYLLAQYIYIIWLGLMMLKAIIGFRANYIYHLRWMGVYNVLLALDCVFEFVRTNLGAIFTDLSGYTRREIIRFYCLSYLLLFLQLYSFIFCWMHLRWVHMEMPYLAEGPVPSLWQPRREEPGSRPPLPGRRRRTAALETAPAETQQNSEQMTQAIAGAPSLSLSLPTVGADGGAPTPASQRQPTSAA